MSIGGDSRFISGKPFDGQGIHNWSAGNLSGAGDAAERAGAMYSGIKPISAGINRYMNPYTNQVINRSIADVRDITRRQLNDVGAQATAAGAFGGSRHGLVEAETMRESQDLIGDLSANLRSQGFNTAATLAGQDINNQLAGAGGLLGTSQQMQNLGTGGYELADRTAQGQMQAGSLQQMLMQQILDRTGAQFSEQANKPAAMLDMMLASLGMSPLNNNKTQTQQFTPGLYDYLQMAAGMGSAALMGR